MLPRLLFVLGMTIGVMAPLVWAAHVSVPASRAVPERPGEWGQKDMVRTAWHEPAKSQATSRSAPTTSSIEAAPAAVSDRPEPKSDLASENAKPAPPDDVTSTVSGASASPRQMVDRAPLRDGPEVVDLYIANGPHIIIVCSELTGLPKLRTGCP